METQELSLVLSTELIGLIYMGVLLLVSGLAPFLAKLLQNDFVSFYKYRESIQIEGWGIRAEKAVKNLYESLPLFMALAIVIHIQGLNSETTTTGVLIFCVSRTIYPVSYIANVPSIRTLSYFGGLIGMIIMGSSFF